MHAPMLRDILTLIFCSGFLHNSGILGTRQQLRGQPNQLSILEDALQKFVSSMVIKILQSIFGRIYVTMFAECGVS